MLKAKKIGIMMNIEVNATSLRVEFTDKNGKDLHGVARHFVYEILETVMLLIYRFADKENERQSNQVSGPKSDAIDALLKAMQLDDEDEG